jgi:hypothetical protein
VILFENKPSGNPGWYPSNHSPSVHFHFPNFLSMKAFDGMSSHLVGMPKISLTQTENGSQSQLNENVDAVNCIAGSIQYYFTIFGVLEHLIYEK